MKAMLTADMPACRSRNAGTLYFEFGRDEVIDEPNRATPVIRL